MEKNFHVPFFSKLSYLHMLFDFKVVESLSRTRRNPPCPAPLKMGCVTTLYYGGRRSKTNRFFSETSPLLKPSNRTHQISRFARRFHLEM
ncbi:hypothetical protein CDAR_562831 [Caerostris darwini]|uniref:Ycf15 n=1 Tax=Caerostris darwini TaxID=1538125 RepID=A0AAV4X7Q5_9ARAC|nr:hypothetical protein CDAR_562831 [Caerostris darwini]